MPRVPCKSQPGAREVYACVPLPALRGNRWHFRRVPTHHDLDGCDSLAVGAVPVWGGVLGGRGALVSAYVRYLFCVVARG